MEWNVIYEMIDPKLLIVVGFCWVLGYVLKQTPAVPDWLIVYLVTLAAVLLTVWMFGFGAESIIQGVLCGAFAVYGHQVIKQSKEREKQ
ncbi:phage holin family protein [Paenibacillus sp. 32O-W]|uniref:phage holin family protein n=1 Tax=Paenibacillus sp. 32O-W TaxID=1695218 RepID=UPI0011A5EB88|nr:phage holin family protein [Paenibacillus sp. 32O-W]